MCGTRDLRKTARKMLGPSAVEPVMRVLGNCANPRRSLALLLLICGEMDLEREHACSKYLHHGRTHYDKNEDGEFTRHYLRKGLQGGLARELGCTGRTIGRCLSELKRGGLVTSKRRPKRLHDKRQIGRSGRPYRTYELPIFWRGLQRYLAAWWKKGVKNASQRSELYRDLSEEADKRGKARPSTDPTDRNVEMSEEGLARMAQFMAAAQEAANLLPQ